MTCNPLTAPKPSAQSMLCYITQYLCDACVHSGDLAAWGATLTIHAAEDVEGSAEHLVPDWAAGAADVAGRAGDAGGHCLHLVVELH